MYKAKRNALFFGRNELVQSAFLLKIGIVIVLISSHSIADESPSSASSEGSSSNSRWLDFTHEKCEREVLTSNKFSTFYSAHEFYNGDGVFELLVRFKGIADGHVILTTNASAEEPRYSIGLGTYNNRFSELRRLSPKRVEVKVSTPSIMSDLQFRGFIIRYDPTQGQLSIYGEGSEVALIHLEDTNEPLSINYFSFATWHNRIVHVAYHCIPKDVYSTAAITSRGCQVETVSGDFSELSHYYTVDPFLGENGILELLVRFKGTSDGHVVLTEYVNASDSDPIYVIILGSYENKVSEIRRGRYSTAEFKINTPEILSTVQFRGFLIRYNEKRGEIWVYSEGSYMPLLHWKDPTPLKVRYFGFSAYVDKVVEVAFNCKPKDLHSLVFQHKPGKDRY